jgi:hypothetical protein
MIFRHAATEWSRPDTMCERLLHELQLCTCPPKAYTHMCTHTRCHTCAYEQALLSCVLPDTTRAVSRASYVVLHDAYRQLNPLTLPSYASKFSNFYVRQRSMHPLVAAVCKSMCVDSYTYIHTYIYIYSCANLIWKMVVVQEYMPARPFPVLAGPPTVRCREPSCVYMSRQTVMRVYG